MLSSSLDGEYQNTGKRHEEWLHTWVHHIPREDDCIVHAGGLCPGRHVRRHLMGTCHHLPPPHSNGTLFSGIFVCNHVPVPIRLDWILSVFDVAYIKGIQYCFGMIFQRLIKDFEKIRTEQYPILLKFFIWCLFYIFWSCSGIVQFRANLFLFSFHFLSFF